jgi:hypothetical protein
MMTKAKSGGSRREYTKPATGGSNGYYIRDLLRPQNQTERLIFSIRGTGTGKALTNYGYDQHGSK